MNYSIARIKWLEQQSGRKLVIRAFTEKDQWDSERHEEEFPGFWSVPYFNSVPSYLTGNWGRGRIFYCDDSFCDYLDVVTSHQYDNFSSGTKECGVLLQMNCGRLVLFVCVRFHF